MLLVHEFTHFLSCTRVKTRFVKSRLVSKQKNSFRKNSFRDHWKNAVSWKLVSWAAQKNRYVSCSWVKIRFVRKPKKLASWAAHEFKLVSWAISLISWAKVLRSLFTGMVDLVLIFCYISARILHHPHHTRHAFLCFNVIHLLFVNINLLSSQVNFC